MKTTPQDYTGKTLYVPYVNYEKEGIGPGVVVFTGESHRKDCIAVLLFTSREKLKVFMEDQYAEYKYDVAIISHLKEYIISLNQQGVPDLVAVIDVGWEPEKGCGPITEQTFLSLV